MWWWTVAAAEPGRLSDPVAPTRQQVHLVLDPEKADYQGTVEITLDVSEKLSSFHLHSQGLTIRSTSLSRDSKTITATATAADTEMLRIDTEHALKPGEWVLKIEFDGKLHDAGNALGLYRIEHNREHYIVSQFEANEARTAWPCFDEPKFKVPFAMIVDVPADNKDLLVVSNAKVRTDSAEAVADSTQEPKTPKKKGKDLPADEPAAASGMRTVHFEQTKPISSYAWALAVGPYTAIDIPNLPVPGRILTLDGRDGQALPLVPEVKVLLGWFERWFGEPYPYDKLDIIAVPGFAFGAMENPGAIVMNDYYLADEAHLTAVAKRELLSVTAHELGHMWFGNLVTLEWWNDFWLNESFADWVSKRAMEETHPELVASISAAARTVRVLQFDGRASARPLRTEIDPVAVFETVNFAVYGKGGALLDTIENWIGREAFRAGVRRYLAFHRFDTATADDLFAALGIASGMPVGDALLPWLDRPGAPTLLFERLPDGHILIRQRRFLVAGSTVAADDQPWPVPLTLRVGHGDGSSELRTLLFEKREQVFDLGDVQWLLPTAEGDGYFTFTLSDDLERALRARTSSLSPEERLRIISANHLGFLAGARSVQDIFETLARAGNESEPEVIRVLLSAALEIMELARESGDRDTIERTEAWLRENARGWLSVVGEPRPHEAIGQTTVREQLLSTLAEANDPEARASLRERAVRFMADPTSTGIEGIGLALRVAAKDDGAFGRSLLDRAKEETDPTLRRALLSAATAAGGFEQRQELLGWALQPDVPRPDLNAVWFAALSIREERDQLIDWQMAHHEEIIAKLPEVHRAGLAQIGGGCSAERVEKVRSFYLDPARRVPGVEQVILGLDSSLQSCRAMQQLHGPELTAALSSQASK